MTNEKNLRRSIVVILYATMILTSALVIMPTSIAIVPSETYTLDADFDKGTLVGVEHETVHDQLQLSKESVTLPFIWVPNTNEGTISKVNTSNGKEIARYHVTPPGLPGNGSPSRTTVDLQGNCWVGVRDGGTVVKIGLYEAGQYIDRNMNGIIETSQDTNGDGNITGAEILPWGQDECVLYEVVLIPGKEGTYAPGNYTGGYDINYWGTSPRGLAIDANNNLWAGTWSTSTYYYINGSTGAILSTLDVSPWGHNAYGAVIDQNGILWSAELSSHILRINTSNLTDITQINLGHTYGVGLDYLGHLFVGGSGYLTKIASDGTILWTKSARTTRGVVCTNDNDVWVAGVDANGTYNSVSRYDNNGNLLTTIQVGSQPSGVAVDAAGKVWACNIGDEYIQRIDPATNSIDLSKRLIGSGGHYTYSDMTGIVARTITTKLGTWTVVFDSEAVDAPWGKVSWTSYEPAGTSVMVKVRSSNDNINWSAWETSTNGVSLNSTPDGRYLQIETTLKIDSGDVSPILYDLTVEIDNRPPVANAGPDQTLEQTSHQGANVTLNGSGSYDPDGDTLAYNWTWTGGSATGVSPTVVLPLGMTTVTLTVSDGLLTDTDTVNITVVDTTPPNISVTVSPDMLWPPNHKMVDILATVTVSDICDAAPSVVLTSITCDEPDDTKGKPNDSAPPTSGDGNTTDDIQGAEIGTEDYEFQLRAERAGAGDGRVYTITYTVTDASGNTASASATVVVAHNQG